MVLSAKNIIFATAKPHMTHVGIAQLVRVSP